MYTRTVHAKVAFAPEFHHWLLRRGLSFTNEIFVSVSIHHILRLMWSCEAGRRSSDVVDADAGWPVTDSSQWLADVFLSSVPHRGEIFSVLH